jgi:N-carbamoylputrescine amidase
MSSAPRTVTVAAIQMAMTSDQQANLERVDTLIRQAAARGAQIILPSELFSSLYFCKTQDERFFDTAYPLEEHPAVRHLQALAAELAVVLPISFFERSGQAYYNSITVADADGTLLGTYRKSHIPDGPGYTEKFYFAPGDTGFRVWNTRYARLGVGICWDQWYPECARAMMLAGAEVLMYPTAIGSEPHDPELDTRHAWRLAMLGHSVSNVVPVVASNRVGDEDGQCFYGTSFITAPLGRVVQDLDDRAEGVLVHTFDLDTIARDRAAWGFFRDRRPELYDALTTRDGRTRPR